jgi:hypothetical protein
MRNIISSMESEYKKYKQLAELAIAQLSDAELAKPPSFGANSIITLMWHLSGNLKSRFTDFLTTDGEKPWRNKVDEFSAREANRDDLLARWNDGWNTLFQSLTTLTDADLTKVVNIVGKPHRVDEALHRSLAHASYHVGQIVYQAKTVRGAQWKDLKTAAKK